MRSATKILFALVVVLLLAVAGVATVLFFLFRATPLGPLDTVQTIAGASANYGSLPFGEVFGIAAGPDGTIYTSDGQKGIIWQIGADGTARPLVEGLATPSGLAVTADGRLLVADPGTHTVQSIDPGTGQMTLVAGVANQPGYADGDRNTARFNAPVGVAAAPDGTIYVADTYNDRIRAIDPTGTVRTIAGGDVPGYVDAPDGLTARFDTPGGIAVAPDGAVIVADTGNRRIRRIEPSGAVTTIAGNGEYGEGDGLLLEVGFVEPIGVAVDAGGSIYVADAGADSVRVCQTKLIPIVATLAGDRGRGLVDGAAAGSRLNRPSGVALAPNGTVLVADTGNRLVRAIISPDRLSGRAVTLAEAKAMEPDAPTFRAAAPGRWPYEPGDRTREIAATYGEIRGVIGPDEPPAYFHNGLDIPGAYGETARAVRAEKVLQLLPIGDLNGTREWLRLPTMG